MKNLQEKQLRFFMNQPDNPVLPLEENEPSIVAEYKVDASNTVYLAKNNSGSFSFWGSHDNGDPFSIDDDNWNQTSENLVEAMDALAKISWPVIEITQTTSTSNEIEIPVTPDAAKAKTVFEVSDIEILDEEKINDSAFAKAGLKKQPDLLYVRFKLMHEGGNKNLDYFEKDELKAAAGTPVLKHLNWEHSEPTIGAIYRAEFVEPDSSKAATTNEKAHIIAEAVVWKFRYPEIAAEMVARHASKKLAFSMEAYFTQAQCSECGEVFAAQDCPDGSYCEHLNKRFDAMASSGEPVYRKLKGFILGGAGVVEDPADVEAEALALAARSKEVNSLDKKIELTQAELDAKIKDAVDKALAEAADKADVETLTERAEAAEAEAKAKSDALSEATETIASLTAERDEARQERDDLKTSIEREAKAAERKAALDEAGYVAPENEEEAEAAMAKFIDMDDDIFELFTTTVKANAKKPEDPPAGKSQAGRIPASGGTAKASNKKLEGTALAADILSRL